MATIGTLAVNIVAQTDRFSKGLDKVGQTLKGFVGQMTGLQAVIAGAATGAFAMLVNSAVEAGGKIQELTAKLNISAEAITALHFAADQLGSSGAAVDAAIGKMSLTLGKALAGNDQAIAAFNNLGLSINALAALDTEQQFLAVIDALHKMPAGATQAAAATGVLSKSYKEILPLIQAGTAAIVEQGQRAVETGAVISGEQVAALDDAGDAIARLSASWEGFKLQMVSFFAPVIAGAMDVITDAIKVLKTIWWGTQVVILDGLAKLAQSVGWLEEKFSWLPLVGDWLAQDAAGAKVLADELTKVANSKVANIQGLAGGTSPLAMPTADVAGHTQTGKEARSQLTGVAADKKAEEKATADNTKIIAEQMKLLNSNLAAGRGTSQSALDAVKVRVAGVR